MVPAISIDYKSTELNAPVPEKLAALKQHLLDYMESQQPFLNPELTLYDLAAGLNVTYHQ